VRQMWMKNFCVCVCVCVLVVSLFDVNNTVSGTHLTSHYQQEFLF